MNRRHWPCVLGLILFSTATATAAEPADPIRFARDNNVLYLNAADLARSLEFDLKIVDPQGLVTFCRDQDGGVCIPIRLTRENHKRVGEQLLIAADTVSRALRFRVIDTAERITIEPRIEPTTNVVEEAAPGYNAPWGRGRGFRKGETLPDIPLVNVAGNEVRFSQFLGKRYILYCWASW